VAGLIDAVSTLRAFLEQTSTVTIIITDVWRSVVSSSQLAARQTYGGSSIGVHRQRLLQFDGVVHECARAAWIIHGTPAHNKDGNKRDMLHNILVIMLVGILRTKYRAHCRYIEYSPVQSSTPNQV
jgi:hypothetical protein